MMHILTHNSRWNESVYPLGVGIYYLRTKITQSISSFVIQPIRVHLSPGSQLVCLLTQSRVIVTRGCIFVFNLHVVECM